MEVFINELEKLLKGGGAHVTFKDATADIPFEALGQRPHGLPYSIWQLVEHIRIAQWDMLEFSRNHNHKSPKWPEEYWPKELAPADKESWDASLRQIAEDLNAFLSLLNTKNLYEPFAHGSGQSLLREALQIADHTAYHLAEIVVIRRLLGIWKP